MNNKKLFLVSLAILTIFMLGAVSATEDISGADLTVEESTLDSIEEINDEVELSENEENDLAESQDSEDLVSDKQTIDMKVGVWDNEIQDYYTELTPRDVYDDLYIKVSLSQKVNGTLSLYMDGKFVSDKKITAKTHYFNFNVKEIGKHTAEVRYSGDDNYNPCSTSSTFEIVSCYIDCGSVIYGSNLLTIFIEADEPAGDVVAIVNGKHYTAPVVRSAAVIELENLNVGVYPIHIDYSGKLVSRSFDGNFDVYPDISISDWEIGLNENNEVSLMLPSNAKGNLFVMVDDEIVADVALVNGYASVSLNKFNELGREYLLEAKYTGSDYYVDSRVTSFSIAPQIEVDYEMIRNQEYTLTFTLPNTYSGDLKVYAPGYDSGINARVVNGKASVKFLAKGNGYEDIQVVYEDNEYSYDNYRPVFMGNNPNMIATVESKVGQDPVFKVNVAGDAGGAIFITINGKEYSSSYFTGSGSLSIPGLADGTYTATVTYTGDYKYSGVSKTITFTKTSKQTPTKKADKISLKLAKVTVKKSAKKLVLKATLKINGKVAKGKKITFKFNKKTYKAKTNKKGVAKVTIKKPVLKKLKVGKKVKYQASYGKITVKKTVKVKK
ncbi:MAG: hypothetical protein IJ258_10800 [Methanobrevibacter sp.]|uniref:Ig-like domain-containing protein n=1 Tax=Methanobrevibacter sp. TaxID=66852 RepID=UPI0025D733E9|nr:Ig-like domain-containing protein [Methanobrevibacter sp.]MBQ8018575.1 hypothetical protein [Methanobrevibacter sp.]